jgi:crotonobetainyl-CoA:carnitine CoA-transferase CaiB-like acyl-CoA transferase
VKNRTLVDEAVGGWFATKTRDEALAAMREAGATVGPVYAADDIVEDEHFREREIVVEVEDADLGSLPVHNIVPRLSATPGVWRRPAPKLGEHTEEVLREAGLGAADIKAIVEGAQAA